MSAPSVMTAPAELGGCKPNAAGAGFEANARKEAEKFGLSKEEVLARLIYSEALSTGYWKDRCTAASDRELMRNIGWGVVSRMRKGASVKGDPYYATIFQPKQYSTSFSEKSDKKNPFAVSFLCPARAAEYLGPQGAKKAAVLYKQAQDIADDIVRTRESTGTPAKYAKITNFFYPRSEYRGEIRPKDWARNPDPEKNEGYLREFNHGAKPCAEFYDLRKK